MGRADGRKWAGLMGGNAQGCWEEVSRADGRKWAVSGWEEVGTGQG